MITEEMITVDVWDAEDCKWYSAHNSIPEGYYEDIVKAVKDFIRLTGQLPPLLMRFIPDDGFYDACVVTQITWENGKIMIELGEMDLHDSVNLLKNN